MGVPRHRGDAVRRPLHGVLVFRLGYEEVARAASGHLHLWIGGLNTAVLLTSSLTMALAVTAAREGRVSRTVWHLLGTAALGLTFLGIKATSTFPSTRKA